MDRTMQGVYSCGAGNMELTADLNQRLTDCYISHIREPRNMPFDGAIGSKWFCPGCGIPIAAADGYVRCSRCGRNLGEFVFALIEHCYHAR